MHELTGQSQVDYVCELKLDGMSMALRFEGGKLERCDHPRRWHGGRGCHRERAHRA